MRKGRGDNKRDEQEEKRRETTVHAIHPNVLQHCVGVEQRLQHS